MGTYQSRVVRALVVVAALLTSAYGFVGVATAAEATSPDRTEPPASLGGSAPEATAGVAAASAIEDQADLCARVGHAAGFPDDRLVTAVAIGLAESRCVPSAIGANGPTSGCPSGSDDRGLWQINDCYHPEVTDACAFDAQCNAHAAYRISSGGTSWTPWTTYKNGAYRNWLDEAQAAVDRLLPPLGNGSVVARDNGNGTYLEAVLAGGHAFPLSGQDKIDLGLGPARVIDTAMFNGFLAAPVANGTVIAKPVGGGAWMEAVVAAGHAFPLSGQDKVELGLGRATGIPGGYFDGFLAAPVANGAVIAKPVGGGAWMEAVVAGGHAFPLSGQDKVDLGLGAATGIPAGHFDGLLNTPIANGTVIAKPVGGGAWMEAIVVGGHAFPLSGQDKIDLGLGAATGVPAGHFNGLLGPQVANGTVIAKPVGGGAWMEAVVVGGHAFPLSGQDKVDLGLGRATGIPAGYFDGLLNTPITNGTVIAKPVGGGAWMEAVVVGGHAFPLSGQDKIDLGLGAATGIPAGYFDGLLNTPITNGTVIAKPVGGGAWMEAVVVGGHAFPLSGQDKIDLGLGAATGIPAGYFDGLLGPQVANGTVIAKRVGDSWMEALVVGGRAFVLTTDDKAWLGLGPATGIPAGYFDGLVATPIAERTVIARRNPDDTYLEAYIVNGRAVPVSQEDKIRLGLGPATVLPTNAFNALL